MDIEVIESIITNAFPGETPCLDRLAQEWAFNRPLLNKKILLNSHITVATLFVVRNLLLGGAHVELSSLGDLTLHEFTKFPVYKNLSEILFPGQYDILIDCGGGLFDVIQPKLGIVELTKTDKYLQCKKPFPIISVDESSLKNFETFFGTGHSFWQALEGYFSQEEYLDEPDQYSYCVVGYGKVGRGICHALLANGISRANISIFDYSHDVCQKAQFEDHINAMHFKLECLAQVKEQLNRSDFIITATGVFGCMSQWMAGHDIDPSIVLINMGTPDEWGPHFEKRVLNQGKPFNFSLDTPTLMRYLDPIFTSLCLAAEHLVTKQLPSGFQPFSKKISQELLCTLERHYSISLLQNIERFPLDTIFSKTQSKIREKRAIYG